MSKGLSKFTVTFALTALLAGSAQFCFAAESKSVKDYVNLALVKSPVIKQAELSLEKSKISQTDNVVKGSLLSLKQAEVSTNAALRAFEATKRTLKLDVETGYFNLLKAQKALLIAQQSAKQAEEQLGMVKIRVNQGLASKLDQITSEKQAKSAEVSLRKAGISLEQAKANFRKLIGSDEDIQLVEDVTEPTPVAIPVDQAVKMASERSVEVAAANEALELAKIQQSMTQNDFTPVNQKRLADISVIEAEMALSQRQAEVGSNVASYYNSLQDALDQFDMAKKSISYAEENARVVKLRFNAGLETASALIQSEISLTSAKIELLDASSSYNLAKAKLMNYIGTTEDNK